MTVCLTAPNGETLIGTGLPTVLINDQLRVLDQLPEIFDQLFHNEVGGLIDLARAGYQSGLDMVDILIYHPELNEVDLLPRIVHQLNKEVGCPISLDSRNPQALEAALTELKPFNAVINSVTAEKEVLDIILPIAKKFDAVLVGMPIGDKYGLPKTVDERLYEANIIVETCEGFGISRDRILMDGVVLASAAEPESFQITLESLKAYRDRFGVATILGIGNAGFGMPKPTVVDLAYLIGAIPWGLNSALVNPHTIGLVETVRAMDFLVNNDIAGRRYIQWYRKNKKPTH
ncbi:MAG: dihydropteroate synthase [Anaerolineaceae bacterium]